MDQKNSIVDNVVFMQPMDRRRGQRREPPYITDEGFVVVDRRGEEAWQAVPAAARLCESDAEAMMY